MSLTSDDFEQHRKEKDKERAKEQLAVTELRHKNFVPGKKELQELRAKTRMAGETREYKERATR